MLRVLRTRPQPAALETLATLVTAARADEDPADVGDDDREATRIALVHTHLPKLVETGLVTWNRVNGTVTTTSHPALADDAVGQLLDVEDVDDVLRTLRSRSRRQILAILAVAGPLDRRELARRVAARETGVEPAAVAEADVEDAMVALHHVHLPALERAELIEVEGATVRFTGHPVLDADWLRSA